MSRRDQSNGISSEAVKVVIINTRYVETDAMSFKSVVQRLTGKDSTAAETGGAPPSGFVRKRKFHGRGGSTAAETETKVGDLSFKDFDKLFKELPPLGELYRAIY